jgi:hypothetical protein
MDRRRMVTGAAAIGAGSIAARLARLERALVPQPPDGDPLVIAFEVVANGTAAEPGAVLRTYEYRGTVGRDSHVVLIGSREDGPA